MARNISVGMTHAEYQLFTIINRQGQAGASQGWLSQILSLSRTRISVLVNSLNTKLDGCRVKSDGVVYRVVTLQEAAFLREVGVSLDELLDACTETIKHHPDMQKFSGVWA